jgi:hypothetical protein
MAVRQTSKHLIKEKEQLYQSILNDKDDASNSELSSSEAENNDGA